MSLASPHPPFGPPPVAPPFRRATRDTESPIAGGVSGGLAAHFGVPVLWVRVAFVVLAVLDGVGLMLYAGLWMFLPTDSRFDESAPGLESATRTGKRPRRTSRLRDAGPAIAIGALLFGAVLAFEAAFGQGALFWPVVIAVAGIALLWRQADEAQRERWLDSTGRIDPFRAVFGVGGWASYFRVFAGLSLVVGALIMFAVWTGTFAFAVPVIVAGLLGVLGLAIVVGPWAVRLVHDLGAERAERVRSQERADMAAHLHDSVLQTLALIQKNSGDAAMVARLARSQERDLRSWLFESVGTDVTLAGELRAVAAIVEDTYSVVVDVVAVGDVDMNEALKPITDAAREGMANAAKHAGVQHIDVYAEVSATAVDVFVRDRGAGFDTSAIAGDRQGVRGSIIDRMARHGGTGEVRSAPGDGTEVRLHLPLTNEESP
ncbi:PspC domain-containing protein [Nocardioides sp.]|uniref:ATP-binding protein n=1 Tax=Nocardioides sp. TaxID=35761 RepID=UPI002CED5096|nr:PspC domain-containing protein [Nocardioides sp.]HXH77044.1 PspC domain-containing protein [Nocardioides sp.]